MSSWKTECKPLSESTHHYCFLDSKNKRLSFDEVIRLWCEDTAAGAAFRELTTRTLSESSFVAYKWETPVVDRSRLSRDFEFVLLKSSGLNRKENPNTFAEHFERAKTDQLTLQFPNIGRNAALVVPTPSQRGPTKQVNHCHLASFLRTASREHSNDFWLTVGDAMRKRVSNKPVWLSTAGGGVAWLHARLDDRPKYYGYEPFRDK